MEQVRGSNTFRLRQLCRLCGFNGHHDKDILENSPNAGSPNDLDGKIFRCVGIRVKRNDKLTTKICQSCVDKIDDIVQFRELCAATDIELRILLGLNGDDNNGPDISHEHLLFTGATNGQDAEIVPSDSKIDCSNGNVSSQNHPIPIQHETRATNRYADYSAMETYGLCQEEGTRQRPPIIYQTKNFGMDNFDDNSETSSSADTIESDPQQSNPSTNAPVMYSFSVTAAQSESVEVCKATGRNPKCAAKTKKRVKRYAVKSVPKFSMNCRSPGGCKESFDSWDAMNYHLSTYHAKGVKKTFCCHLCQKTLSSGSNLVRHVKSVHMGERSFQCPFPMCSSAYAHKSDLKGHTESMHIKKIELKCTKCPFKTYHRRSLRRHMASSRNHD